MNFNTLEAYIPENSVIFIEKWLKPYSFILKIKNSRKNKLGDYRKPLANAPHIITINNDMDKELCFLTITHEIAHLIAFDIYHNKILPHGKEWKLTFANMILESLTVYSSDFQPIVQKYAMNPKAGFYSDKNVAAYFLKKDNANILMLSDLDLGEEFILKNRRFIKLKKNKIRYICKDIVNGRNYIISPLAEVEKIIKK